MAPGVSVGDAFYFAVETFLTIGYGDITPATDLAKVFFIVFTVVSLIIQLTVLSAFVSSTLSFSPSSTAPEEEEEVVVCFCARRRSTLTSQRQEPYGTAQHLRYTT
jgi:voltage-gated potassium channel Kch